MVVSHADTAMQPKTRNKVLGALRECGPMSVRELQQQLGKGSRGCCSLYVLDYFTHIRGLSAELRSALYVLLWRGDIAIVSSGRTLRLVLSCR
jgi:hypothetical protein